MFGPVPRRARRQIHRTSSIAPYRRRTALALLATTILLLALIAGPPVGLGAGAQDDRDERASSAAVESRGYAVVQGDRCAPIEALGDGSETVEAFYDYRTPETEPSAYAYSSYGTTHLQADDTSSLFLYEGADGLSLVLIHDRLDGETAGGSITMGFEDLPADGEWAVEDDDYDGRDDEFAHDGDASRITWVWSEGRTDGAAFSGLGDEFAVTIAPAFNEAADFRYTDDGYDGQITDWQVLSGEERDPDRTSLDPGESIVVRSAGCSAVTDVTLTSPVTVGDDVTIEATVRNDGERSETVTVPFVVNGTTVDERTLTLEAGETATVETTVTAETAGVTGVAAGEVATEFEAAEPATDEPFDARWLGVVGAATAVGALALVVIRLRR